MTKEMSSALADQMIRSARPDSQDGLFDPNGNVAAGLRGVYATARTMQILAGIMGRKPAWVSDGAKKITETLSIEPPEFLKQGYQDWPGTDKPWKGAPSGNGLTKPNDGLGKQGLPGLDPRSGIPSNARDEALVKKMHLIANEPFDPLNAAAGKVGNPQHVTAGTQLFQGRNGWPVTDTTDWQHEANVGAFESAHEAVPFASYQTMPYSAERLSGQTFEDQAPVLRLVPQPQGDLASTPSPRPQVDQSVPASAAPSAAGDISELLKLRAIVQAMGSRGIFPVSHTN